jgi:hypothetical protein
MSKYLKILRFSLVGNKESVLEQLCTYFLPIHSVVYRNCIIGVSLCAPMLENYKNLINYSMVIT